VPIVSVVMPLYNSAPYMRESIGSVLKQTFQDWELILIDDCSGDESLAVAREFSATDSRIRTIALPQNRGGGEARNAGIAAAEGRYIAFLDSDDLWDGRKLEIQLTEMQKQQALLSYTDFDVIKANGALASIRRTPPKVGYRDLLKNNVIGCSTAVYDAGRLGKRYFMTIRLRQDFALWLSILRDIDFGYRCGPVLMHYRMRQGSVSADKLKAARSTWRLYRDIEKLPIPLASYYFVNYAVAAVRKRI
jgi:teichuronic acid biosynthesis glycosyltransferase TuaG